MCDSVKEDCRRIKNPAVASRVEQVRYPLVNVMRYPEKIYPSLAGLEFLFRSDVREVS